MKTKLVPVLAAIAVIGITATTIAVVEENSGKRILNENVDALMSSEGMFGPMCTQTGNAGSYYMKNCRDCGGSFGYYDMDSVAFCFN